jgi:Cys-rich protein (TIGR01571 family)
MVESLTGIFECILRLINCSNCITDWPKNICGCCRNIRIFGVSCLICGQICLSARIAGEIQKDKTSNSYAISAFLLSACLCCVGSAINRSRIRRKYEIGGCCLCDCLTHMFLPWCAITQEWRQVFEKDHQIIELRIPQTYIPHARTRPITINYNHYI